jgi:glycosyltransferase involved in cell wall biosynthesis
MKSNNLVSIIMTCHNGESFLHEAVKSVINQTYSNWELIFYNNKSIDKSEKIIKNFKDKRIKYFRLNKLVNLGTIRKLAFSKCQGDFVSFLDVDDYWKKNKLEKQVKIFEMNNNIDVVYSNYYKVESKKIKRIKKKLHRGYCQNEIIFSYVNGSPLTAWLTLMIKKSAIDKLEVSFDKKTHISSDFDLIIRLSIFCNFDYSAEYLGYYRLHQQNESKSKKKEIGELIYIINKYQKNKIISSIFFYKNFAYKLYIKYFIFKKLKSIDIKNFVMIKRFNIRLLYFITRIIPKEILNNFIKS